MEIAFEDVVGENYTLEAVYDIDGEPVIFTSAKDLALMLAANPAEFVFETDNGEYVLSSKIVSVWEVDERGYDEEPSPASLDDEEDLFSESLVDDSDIFSDGITDLDEEL